MGVVAQRLEHRGLAGDLGDTGVQRRGARHFQVDELVDHQHRHQRPADAVVGGAALLPALHGLAMAVPEVGRQRQHAGVEQVAVFQRLVVEVVLGRQAQGARLDAHVDVLGHQHHVAPRLLLAQALHHAQDLVVGLALRQARRQLEVEEGGLEVELAAGLAVAGAGQRDAGLRVHLAVLGGQCRPARRARG